MRTRGTTRALLCAGGLAIAGCATEEPADGPDPATAALTAPAIAEADYRAFAEHIAAELAAAGVPGGALGLVVDGRLAFATGLGVADAASGAPVGTDTVFRVASTTKTFTAAAVMSLVDDGVVALDAPITRYLPELRLQPPHDPSRLTLRRLLSHTAGVPDYLEFECADGPDALAAWFAAHPNLTLWTPPGRLWSYSNLGYSLAGLVAERAAGAPFRQLVEDRVLGPLAMGTATFDVDEVIARGDHAVAHPRDPIDATLTRCGLTDPPGYLYASVRDLGRFTEAVLAGGEGAVDPGSLLQMALPHTSTQAPPDAFYGLGLFQQRYNSLVVVGHPGDLPGMHSAWWLVPGRRFGVIVLVNGDGYPPTRAAIQAIDAFLAPAPVPATDWSTPPSDWQRYVGHYASTVAPGAFPPYGLGAVTVSIENEHLYATLDDGSRYELFQAARDTFYALSDGTPVVLTFWRGLFGRGEYIATRGGAARRSWLPAPVAKRAGGENAIQRIARQAPFDPALLLTLRR
jgi:CubicO group peptidase (beta-lactamase class C family)